MAALGIEGFVKRLETLYEEFAEVLEKSKTKEIDFREVEAARNRGNLFVRQIIVKTMGNTNTTGIAKRILSEEMRCSVLFCSRQRGCVREGGGDGLLRKLIRQR